MAYRFELTEAPEQEPVTRDEFKDYARYASDVENDLIDDLLVAARMWVEEYLGRKLITSTYTLYLDEFEVNDKNELVLPVPVQSINSIKYYDSNEDEQTWSSSEYSYSRGYKSRIKPKPGYNWPTPIEILEAIEIEMVCGYGDEPEDVPPGIKLGIKRYANNQFQHREDPIIGASVSEVAVPARITFGLLPFRVISL